MYDSRMIVKNSNCHFLTYCETVVMIVVLRNFHKRKYVVPDSNFWCGCPVKTGILLGEKVLFGVYISKRVVQKMGSWLPHDI